MQVSQNKYHIYTTSYLENVLKHHNIGVKEDDLLLRTRLIFCNSNALAAAYLFAVIPCCNIFSFIIIIIIDKNIVVGFIACIIIQACVKNDKIQKYAL